MRIALYIDCFKNPIVTDVEIPEGQNPRQFVDQMVARIRWEQVSGGQLSSLRSHKVGRPVTTAARIPAKFKKYYPDYQSGKLNICEYARLCGISRPTVYKYIRILKAVQKEND